jgi:hypothetical protein
MNRAFPYLSPNGDETGAGADHTDNSGLLTGPTFYVNPDGSMAGEAFPRPQIEDDSCIGVATCGQVRSGPFDVRFSLDDASGKYSDFRLPAGCGHRRRHNFTAAVHFAQLLNADVNYTLSAMYVLAIVA